MLTLLEEVLFGSLEFKQWHSFYLKLCVLQMHLDPVLKCLPSLDHLSGTANHGHQQCDQIAECILTLFRKQALKIFHLATFIYNQSNKGPIKVPFESTPLLLLDRILPVVEKPPLLSSEYRKYLKLYS